MKKDPMLLVVVYLLVGMYGCATDDGVQKGYLAPQQTPSSSTQTASAGPTTGDRLPAPSVTQEVSSADSSASARMNSSTPNSTSNPSDSSPSSAVSKSSLVSSPSVPSPASIAKNDQRPGGKVGGPGASIRRRTSAAGEQEKPESRASRAAGKEQDVGEDAARKEPGSGGVSANLSSGVTRVVAEPTGNAKGVVVTANSKAKFVVVKFQYRAVPAVGKVLSVMRNGEKVGQIKMTKPIKAPHGTADILEGDVQRGDTVE